MAGFENGECAGLFGKLGGGGVADGGNGGGPEAALPGNGGGAALGVLVNWGGETLGGRVRSGPRGGICEETYSLGSAARDGSPGRCFRSCPVCVSTLHDHPSPSMATRLDKLDMASSVVMDCDSWASTMVLYLARSSSRSGCIAMKIVSDPIYTYQ